MTKEDALDTIWMRCQHNDKTFEAYCVLKRELGLNELDGGDRVKHELKTELNELEPKYCDRNICLSNEYNGISCDECEVMKSQDPCEDAISRQAVLDQTYLWSKDEFLRVTNPFDYLRKRINSLPTVTPKQRTGRWEWVQYDGNPNIGNWHCTECDRIVCGAITAANPVYAYKYCPNCGAKIKEVENEVRIISNSDKAESDG